MPQNRRGYLLVGKILIRHGLHLCFNFFVIKYKNWTVDHLDMFSILVLYLYETRDAINCLSRGRAGTTYTDNMAKFTVWVWYYRAPMLCSGSKRAMGPEDVCHARWGNLALRERSTRHVEAGGNCCHSWGWQTTQPVTDWKWSRVGRAGCAILL